MMPACRMPPPKTLRCRTALAINVARTGECRADRRAEPLREANADRIEMPGPFRGLDACGDNGVEESCAVQMGHQSLVMSPAANGGDVFERQHPTAAAIVRILQTHQARGGAMRIVGAQ